MILITGGAKSGKSVFAEKKANEIGKKILYIATAIPFDDEMKNKIKIHKLRRPKSWDTFEGYIDLDNIIYKNNNKYDCILFDCITLFITNYLQDFLELKYDISSIENIILNELKKIIDITKNTKKEIIFVTNELGMSLVPENKLGRIFRDISGNINQFLAKESNEVYMVISGIPIKIK